jgi:hypothetical protein
MWQKIWRRRVKTLLQYLIFAEEKNFPVIQRTLFRSDGPLATHYSSEPATALLVVRIHKTKIWRMRRRKRKEEKQPENRIFQ